MVRFKVRQTELVIVITQIYHWKVAHGEDATLADQRKQYFSN